ncbi:mechanosensitive ion channel family protein [bacterium]|nr:mechanosensitive ion channel family protein [bacterium]
MNIVDYINTEIPKNLPAAGRVVIIILLALITWWLIRFTLQKIIKRAAISKHVDEKRVNTIISVMRSVVNVTLTGLAGTLVMSELGINLGPILAAAGVVGLAVGFGAQSLIKDILSGFFLLFENQVRVGDVVSASGKAGAVENITLRTLTLRDVAGNVHIIPHGQIDTVTNMTLGWSRVDLKIGIAYREDPDEVVRVMKDVVESMAQEETWVEHFPEPPQVFAIEDLGDSAVVYRVLAKVLPGSQWVVSREMKLRFKKRFDAEGIEIPFPHQTIYFGEDRTGQAPAVRVKQVETAA